MTNTKLSRRELFGITAKAGAAVAAMAASPTRWIFAQDAQGEVVKTAVAGNTAWTPIFIKPDQVETVVTMAELIIPRTDTPGARDARVHEYIDLMLSIDSSRNKIRFEDGIAWIDGQANTLYGMSFVDASPDQQSAILKSVSDENRRVEKAFKPGQAFFKLIKRKTVDGYYTSREGMIEELGRPRSPMHRPFEGCGHKGESHA